MHHHSPSSFQPTLRNINNRAPIAQPSQLYERTNTIARTTIPRPVKCKHHASHIASKHVFTSALSTRRKFAAQSILLATQITTNSTNVHNTASTTTHAPPHVHPFVCLSMHAFSSPLLKSIPSHVSRMHSEHVFRCNTPVTLNELTQSATTSWHLCGTSNGKYKTKS